MNDRFIDIEVLTFVDLSVIFLDLLVNLWTYRGSWNQRNYEERKNITHPYLEPAQRAAI